MNIELEKIINRPSLAIIIDCWDKFDNELERQTMKNIQQFCFDNPMIKTVGLATYVGVDETMVLAEEPWVTHGQEFFYNRLRWDNLCKVWERPQFVKKNMTHDIIRNMPIREDQVQFSFWNNLQLLYYCNYINRSIENIYLLGFSWANCLEWRSLGWKELQNLNTYNLFSNKKTILSNLSCTLDQNKQRVTTVSSPWVNLDENYVMLDSTL